MRLWSLLSMMLVVISSPAFNHAADSIPLGPAHAGVVSKHAEPSRCSEYTAKLQNIVATLPTAAQKHRWVVVCSLEAWNYALHKAGAWRRTNSAFTNMAGRTTFINGAVFEEAEPFYRQTIYHEAGHVICNCQDEARANQEAGRILIPASTPPALGQ